MEIMSTIYGKEHNLTRNYNPRWVLTGMILLPGSFSGKISSPRPHRGPLKKENVGTSQYNARPYFYRWNKQHRYLPNSRMSFAIFIRETDMVFRAPLVSTKASCAACYK